MLGISAGVLAATAADAIWPEDRRGPTARRSIGAAQEGSGGSDSTPAL